MVTTTSTEPELLTRPVTAVEPAIRQAGEIRPRNDGPTIRAHVSSGSRSHKSAQAGLVLALLRALSRRWKPAALLGLVAAAVAGSIIWTQLPPPKPSAAVKLYIPVVPQTVLGQHPDPPLERGTQIALVHSRLVLNAATRPPEINALPLVNEIKAKGGDPVDWLAKNIQADFSEGHEIFRIMLTYDDGVQAKALVDAVKEAYLSEVYGDSKKNRNDKLVSLNKHLERADSTLKTLREQAKALSNENVTLDDKQFKLQQELAANQAAMVKSQLLAVKGDLLRLKAEESAIKGKTAANTVLPDEVLESYIEKDPEVVDLLTKRNDLETRLRNIRKVALDADKLDSTKKLNEQLETMRKQYETMRVNLRGQVEERMKLKSKSDWDFRTRSLKEEIDSSIEMEKLLSSEYDRLNAYIKDGNKTNFDLDPLRIKIKLAEGLYERVQSMITNITLEQDAPPRVRMMEPPYIVPVEETKRKLVMSAIGASGAIALVFALVGFIELNRRRVESSDAVTDQLGMAVIGTIPRRLRSLATRYGNPNRADWKSMMLESINSTRTMLLHGHGLSAARVIQITSPVSGEGKTTLSAHLSTSLAMAGRRTVLVDGDLRNPNANRPFQIPDGQSGLCEILRGETTVDQVLKPTTIPGLTMLPAGKWSSDTPQHLASSALEEVFGLLRNQFEFVIVDSSPVLPVADPLLFARFADGVVVSLLQDSSRLPLVEEANRLLASLRVPVLGVVLHGTKNRSYGYGSNYRSFEPAV
jgi:succinoglycan biosynthesis transport protein ExoP